MALTEEQRRNIGEGVRAACAKRKADAAAKPLADPGESIAMPDFREPIPTPKPTPPKKVEAAPVLSGQSWIDVLINKLEDDLSALRRVRDILQFH